MKHSFVIALLLTGCAPAPSVGPTLVDEAVAPIQQVVVPVVTDVMLSTTSAAEKVLPPSKITTPVTQTPTPADRAVIDMVVRWEVGSPAQYARKYERPICPGGASGPTVGIGADLGTQTSHEIRASWGWHPDVEIMVTASGQTGPTRCAAWVAKYRNAVHVQYADAIRVFTEHDWPNYQMQAARAYHNGWDGISVWHQGGLTSNGYNRGFSFLGDRRKEMRDTRDTCVPALDARCSATQLRASCRVWEGTDIYKGLCARRNSEADFTVREQ